MAFCIYFLLPREIRIWELGDTSVVATEADSRMNGKEGDAASRKGGKQNGHLQGKQ